MLSITNCEAQCPDSSNATLAETTEWITSKIENYGGRLLPPTRYEVFFVGSQMTLYEFGVDENITLKDTVAIVVVNLKDLDLTTLSVRYIGKGKTRFGLSFNGKKGKMSYRSPSLGEMGTGFEIILDCEKDAELPNRLIKAITHGYCISGGISSKEKF